MEPICYAGKTKAVIFQRGRHDNEAIFFKFRSDFIDIVQSFAYVDVHLSSNGRSQLLTERKKNVEYSYMSMYQLFSVF